MVRAMIVWMVVARDGLAVEPGEARWKPLIDGSHKQEACKGHMIEHNGYDEEAGENTADEDSRRNTTYDLCHNERRVQDTRSLPWHDRLDAKGPQQIGKKDQWWPPAQEEPGGMRLRGFGSQVEWHFHPEQGQDDHTE